MSEVPHYFIPTAKILYADAETTKLEVVTSRLEGVGLDPTALFYVGVEGQPLLFGDTWPQRSGTFGFPYSAAKEWAEEVDKYGSALGRSFIDYAFDAEDIPAAVIYDRAMLVESETWAEMWIPKAGYSLETAVRAVLFFAHASDFDL